jgi:hypothetical protein
MLRQSALLGLLLLAGCASHGTTPTPSPVVRQDDVRRVLSALADDSMEGRRTASPGELRAARFVVSEMKAIGLTPAGDSGFIQRVPLAAVEGRRGGEGYRLQDSRAGPAAGARDTTSSGSCPAVTPPSATSTSSSMPTSTTSAWAGHSRATRSTTAPMTMPRA